MKRVLILLALALGLAEFASAQISLGIGIRGSGLSIGINMSSYPRLVQVPGYPVYYYPDSNSNYFFYDGMYWVYDDDNWYASSWYDGPWNLVDPYYVPLFVLRVPVRYYHRPPVYFRGWSADAAPRWGDHWGRDWNSRRNGWDQWDRRSAPRPAPLPSYQSRYSGGSYPRAPEQQHSIRSDKYRYEPKEPVIRQVWQDQQRQQAQQQRPAPQENRQEATPAPEQDKSHKKADEAKNKDRGNRGADSDQSPR